MKRDFQDGPDHLNIEPMPNPKPLTTERVNVKPDHTEAGGAPAEYGFIRNAQLHPAALTERE
jgi:hypothetical protein